MLFRFACDKRQNFVGLLSRQNQFLGRELGRFVSCLSGTERIKTVCYFTRQKYVYVFPSILSSLAQIYLYWLTGHKTPSYVLTSPLLLHLVVLECESIRQRVICCTNSGVRSDVVLCFMIRTTAHCNVRVRPTAEGH